METIKGYSYGKVAQSPVSVTDLELLKKTVLFTSEDEKYLKLGALKPWHLSRFLSGGVWGSLHRRYLHIPAKAFF